MTNQKMNAVAKQHVQAQLEERGYVIGIKPKGSWPSLLIFTHRVTSKTLRVIVKSTVTDLVREKLYGNHCHYSWMANSKHEFPQSDETVYCFVVLRATETVSQLYLVPAAYVSWYVRFQHEKWLASLGHAVKETPTRRFRICEHDPHKFRNNWGLLENPSIDATGLMMDCKGLRPPEPASVKNEDNAIENRDVEEDIKI